MFAYLLQAIEPGALSRRGTSKESRWGQGLGDKSALVLLYEFVLVVGLGDEAAM